jgi:hypothetical protein
MIALASLILPLAIGWVWTEVSGALPVHRGWAVRILQAGLAVAVGFGASSLLFFLLTIAGLAKVPELAVCEVALIAGGVAWLVRTGMWRRGSGPASGPFSGPFMDARRETARRWSAIEWLLLAGFGACVLLAAGVVARTVEALPHGHWDGWAIWNLRARYLAGDGTWRYSVSPLLAETHPDYPVGTSSLIARTWVYGARDFIPSVPAVIGILYGLATLLVLTGAFALNNGLLVSLLGGCVLLSASSWVAEIGAQYADVPLALYFAAAMVLLAGALGRAPEQDNGQRQPGRSALLAGVLAGFAATVKNEGIAFSLVLLLALAVTRAGRRNLLSYSLGLAPLLALIAVFKFTIAPVADPTFHQGLGTMVGKLADPARLGAVLSGLASRVWTMGEWYAHPLLLAAAILFALRVRERARDQYLSLWLASGLMLATYAGVILLTPADLKWQIDTSMDRLLVQLLPAMLASLLLVARPLGATGGGPSGSERERQPPPSVVSRSAKRAGRRGVEMSQKSHRS